MMLKAWLPFTLSFLLTNSVLAADSPVALPAIRFDWTDWCVMDQHNLPTGYDTFKLVNAIEEKLQLPRATEEAVAFALYPALRSAYVKLFTVTDENGWSALHWAAHAGKEKVAKVLLIAPCDVNDSRTLILMKTRNAEVTALHLAAQQRNILVIQRLLKIMGFNGAPIVMSQMDINKKTAYHQAKTRYEDDERQLHAAQADYFALARSEVPSYLVTNVQRSSQLVIFFERVQKALANNDEEAFKACLEL